MVLLKETLIPLPKAAGYFAQPPHPATVVRWALKGVGKPPVKLETCKVGGRRYTSTQAIERFVERLNHLPVDGDVAVADVTPVHNNTNKQLDAEGF